VIGLASRGGVCSGWVPTVSACLLAWKRPQNLDAIVHSLAQLVERSPPPYLFRGERTAIPPSCS